MMKAYCPVCRKENEYTIKKSLIEDFKGFKVNVEEDIAVCNECGEELFIEEIEDNNLKRLYEKYRELSGTISYQDIINLREKYNISQRELVAILNWGKMTINRYENGAIPSTSHNDLLKQMINDELFFKQKVEEAFHKNRITKKTCDKVLNKIEERENDILRNVIIKLLSHEESIENGFKKFDPEKFENLVSYIASRVTLYKTSLNKFLWYIDFLNFKTNSRSITGLTYQKYSFGPIIENFHYELLINTFDDKFFAEEFEYCTRTETIITSKNNFDLSVFAEDELKVIDFIIKAFENKNCTEISNKSHEERGWKEKSNREVIPYDYAEYLSIGF